MIVAVFVEGSSDALLVRLLRRRHRFASRKLVVETVGAALPPDTFVEVVHGEALDSSSDQDVVAAVAVFVLDAVAAADTSAFVRSSVACVDMQSTEGHIHIASVEAVVLADEDDLEAPDSSLCDERAFQLLM